MQSLVKEIENAMALVSLPSSVGKPLKTPFWTLSDPMFS